ncbi:MAG: GNAT family N-acetyltransferase [Jannaschia sp.]
MRIGQATETDIAEMSALLRALAALGKRRRPFDPDFVRETYIAHPDRLHCGLAASGDGAILGFQILKRAGPENVYGVTPGWGIIGTHIHPSTARRGIGRTLFDATRRAAAEAGLDRIDATIGAANAEGRAYYEAMGFRTYRTPVGAICKLYEMTS